MDFKLKWCQVIQGRVDPLTHVDIFKKDPDLAISIPVISIFCQVDFFLLDCADKPLGIAVLPGCTQVGHANPYLYILEFGDILMSRILLALLSIILAVWLYFFLRDRG